MHRSSALPQLKPPIARVPPQDAHLPEHLTGGTVHAEHHSWQCLLGPNFQGHSGVLITQVGTKGISKSAEAERALDFCQRDGVRLAKHASLKIQRHLKAFESRTSGASVTSKNGTQAHLET